MSKIVIAWNNNDGAISNNDRTKLPRLRAEALQRADTPPLVTRSDDVIAIYMFIAVYFLFLDKPLYVFSGLNISLSPLFREVFCAQVHDRHLIPVHHREKGWVIERFFKGVV